MIRLTLIALSLTACLSSPAQARAADPGDAIARGKWQLDYHRSGEFKPLGLRKDDDGTSLTCMDDDPWNEIVDWVRRKGCSIDKTSRAEGTYILEGQCRFKWWKSHATPVRVEMRTESPTRLKLSIKALENSLLDFNEQTTATFLGPCDPKSTAERKQDQSAKD